MVKCDDGSTAAGGMNFRWDAQLTGYGHTFSGGSAAYLFLGRPTDRN